MKMKVLVLGQGGREHAIAWKLSRSPKIEKVFICPGNGGTALEKNIENVDLSVDDSDLLINFTKKENIDITIVGPEGPLVDGLVDKFKEHNLKIFGPTKNYAILELPTDLFKKNIRCIYRTVLKEFKLFMKLMKHFN